MNSTLHDHFERLQTDTQTLLKRVSSLSSVSYHRSPGEGKWSISQILTHLLIAERLSLLYMKKKSLGIDRLDDTGLYENLKFRLLEISQWFPFRYKAPQVLIDHTPPALSYGDIVRQWEASRQDLKNFLEKIHPDHAHRKIYKHPWIGMLNVCHALQFFHGHLQHHRPQVERIIRLARKN